MSRVVTSVCLMLAIMAYSVFAAFVIRNENGKISAIIGEINLYEQSGDVEKASAAADRLNENWFRFERKMSVFVRDDKLNTISASVARVKPYITEANDELDAELRHISRQLELLYRAELPAWYNIL
ncbi:MAG: DUF4363 family protein [Prevotella sp.]|nr:DUF4363 family protein [Prevotella sp.]